MPAEAMDVYAQRLSRELSGTHPPTVCLGCLRSFWTAHFDSDMRAANIHILRRDHHEFWDAIMAFLTSEHTANPPNEFEFSLRSSTRECLLCDQTSPFPVDERHFRPLYAIIRGIFRLGCPFATVSLDDGSAHDPGCSPVLWPASAHDLMPHGPGPTLAWALQQLRALDRGDLHMFRTVWSHCGQELMPFLMNDNSRLSFMGSACTIIHLARDAKQASDEAGRFDADEASHRVESPISLLVLISTILTTSPGLLLTAERLFGDCELPFAKALDTAVAAWDRDPHPRGDVLLESLICLRLIASHVLDPPAGVFACLHRLLVRIPKSHTCAYAPCGARREDLGRRLQRCAGCRVFRYCSRGCQRGHWRSARNSHQLLCAALGQITGETPIDKMTAQAFAEACSARFDVQWASSMASLLMACWFGL
ncbi:hypothetical protein AURDEDRAFT_174276 [Auricularia subglabra TFB-10046 SS5]|uniref:MYND-type domain-containing protein n=1 Tax=Auricularia subglabra (strain TFB-10046 / SS5) TaxID=717982 RepID=J0WTF0_AURST|nr:hypothetical protein AURDEDRAFT_174276 [Auricularia subglabra TFB-10046 SS5]